MVKAYLKLLHFKVLGHTLESVSVVTVKDVESKRFNRGRVRRFNKKRGMTSMIKRVMFQRVMLGQCETKRKSHSFQSAQM